MKLILVFWTIFVLVSAKWVPRTREKMYQDRDECFKKLELTEDQKDKVNREEYPDEPKLRCYLRCILLGGQIWDDEKGYNAERGLAELEIIGMTADVENLRKCNAVNSDNADSCIRAFRVVKCFANNNYITSISQ